MKQKVLLPTRIEASVLCNEGLPRSLFWNSTTEDFNLSGVTTLVLSPDNTAAGRLESNFSDINLETLNINEANIFRAWDLDGFGQALRVHLHVEFFISNTSGQTGQCPILEAQRFNQGAVVDPCMLKTLGTLCLFGPQEQYALTMDGIFTLQPNDSVRLILTSFFDGILRDGSMYIEFIRYV